MQVADPERVRAVGAIEAGVRYVVVLIEPRPSAPTVRHVQWLLSSAWVAVEDELRRHRLGRHRALRATSISAVERSKVAVIARRRILVSVEGDDAVRLERIAAAHSKKLGEIVAELLCEGRSVSRLILARSPGGEHALRHRAAFFAEATYAGFTKGLRGCHPESS